MSEKRIPHTTTWKELRAKLNVNEEEVARLTEEWLAECSAVALGDLRRLSNLTQVELADRLGVDQPRVSRIERGDLSKIEVGTLVDFVDAMGGNIEVIAWVDGKAYPIPVDGNQTGIKSRGSKKTG